MGLDSDFYPLIIILSFAFPYFRVIPDSYSKFILKFLFHNLLDILSLSHFPDRYGEKIQFNMILYEDPSRRISDDRTYGSLRLQVFGCKADR